MARTRSSAVKGLGENSAPESAYAALLARQASGDTVEIEAISSDGDAVTASFLLGSGVSMMAETTHNDLPEPDNTAVVEYMKDAMRQALVHPSAVPGDVDALPGIDDLSDYNSATG